MNVDRITEAMAMIERGLAILKEETGNKAATLNASALVRQALAEERASGGEEG